LTKGKEKMKNGEREGAAYLQIKFRNISTLGFKKDLMRFFIFEPYNLKQRTQIFWDSEKIGPYSIALHSLQDIYKFNLSRKQK